MKATRLVHEFGQSFWLENITRDLLDNGTPKHVTTDNLRRRNENYRL
jgi:hypothetical protein